MPKTKMVETGNVELIVRAPNLSQENAQTIARDVRYALENCAKLKLLNEFTEMIKVEYAEVSLGEKELDIKCKVCGGDLIMGPCATECMKCGASVDSETGEPYMDGEKVVKVCSFGGRNIL